VAQLTFPTIPDEGRGEAVVVDDEIDCSASDSVLALEESVMDSGVGGGDSDVELGEGVVVDDDDDDSVDVDVHGVHVHCPCCVVEPGGGGAVG